MANILQKTTGTFVPDGIGQGFDAFVDDGFEDFHAQVVKAGLYAAAFLLQGVEEFLHFAQQLHLPFTERLVALLGHGSLGDFFLQVLEIPDLVVDQGKDVGFLIAALLDLDDLESLTRQTGLELGDHLLLLGFGGKDQLVTGLAELAIVGKVSHG